MSNLYFVEYFRSNSSIPVNMTIGCKTKKQAIAHGKLVCQSEDYSAFWILSKPTKGIITGTLPERIEYHSLDSQGNWMPIQRGANKLYSFV